jgi:hypothetical protein
MDVMTRRAVTKRGRSRFMIIRGLAHYRSGEQRVASSDHRSLDQGGCPRPDPLCAEVRAQS